MALKLPKGAEKKPTGFLYLEKEGLYKVTISENEDKVDENEKSKRHGYSFHSLRFKFENGRTSMARIYYKNEEEDIVPEGYNFILALAKIAKNAYEGDERMIAKIEGADSNKIIELLIKEKIPFYIATKNSIYQGTDVTNVNSFIDPIATLEEAEEFAEKKKTEVVTLEEKKAKKTTRKEAEEDDSEENDDDFDDDDDL
ncbi:MAG: hypothetical protein EOM19_02140 [Candidatus Moranbacteria bacterium]|nr:hypothetical protein [Candidatus Moranbacteria bacterium]